jgi:hypothetical protein
VLRGRNVSRLEGFSDAVFGFAVTLLVVSLEVPDSFADLQRIIAGFPAFAVTFAVICWVWYEHYLFFHHYGLEDGLTVVVNCVLLFIVVFYAYPMKFMFTRLISGTLMGIGPSISDGMSAGDGQLLMVVYSAGFVAVFAAFMVLHANAYRRRAALGLDALAVYDARASVARHGISVAIGLASIAIALLLPVSYLPFAGLLFFLLGPAHGFYGYWNGRRRERVGTLAMKTLFDPAVREDFCQRVDRLTAESAPRWGKFTAAQMLAHLNDSLRMAIGELPTAPKKGPFRYWPLKPLVLYVLPFPKSVPTAPELLKRCATADLAAEQDTFKRLAERAASKPVTDRWPDHPAFGTLDREAWGKLGWKHTEHHLKQFGV